MTPELRELFRQEIVRQLVISGAVSMKVMQLKLGVRARGFEPTDAEIDAELLYLADKGLVTAQDKAISPELKRWRITAEGRDFAAQEGLG